MQYTFQLSSRVRLRRSRSSRSQRRQWIDESWTPTIELQEATYYWRVRAATRVRAREFIQRFAVVHSQDGIDLSKSHLRAGAK